MNTYLIAGLKVNVKPFGKFKSRFDAYATEFTHTPDIQIDISDKQYAMYMERFDDMDKDTAFYCISGFLFYRALMKYDGFMLHSSAVVKDGEAYLFSGQSGIGKSTHTNYWLELLGDRAFILNDDKPAILVRENGIFACGTPWSGKHDISRNVSLPVKALCFISRGEENSITRLPENVAAIHMVHQCTKNFNSEQWEKILSMMDSFVKKVPVFKLKCIKDVSAAKLSLKTMSGEIL